MESLSPYDNKQDSSYSNNNIINNNINNNSTTLQPTTSRPITFFENQSIDDHECQSSSGELTNQQRTYQVKCDLLEYHIHEATLINKALKSELKQYQDKIDFEKKLKKFLINRIKGFDS